jgi:hypothetical protein
VLVNGLSSIGSYRLTIGDQFDLENSILYLLLGKVRRATVYIDCV